jgi:hypothetical protein
VPSVAVERETTVRVVRQRSWGMHGHFDRVVYGPSLPDFWEMLARLRFPDCCEDCGGPLILSEFEVGRRMASVCARCYAYYFSFGGEA